MSVGYVMSGWENGRGLPVVCPPQSFLSQKADGQREISWLFRGFGDTGACNIQGRNDCVQCGYATPGFDTVRISASRKRIHRVHASWNVCCSRTYTGIQSLGTFLVLKNILDDPTPLFFFCFLKGFIMRLSLRPHTVE